MIADQNALIASHRMGTLVIADSKSRQGGEITSNRFCLTYSFYGILCAHFTHQKMVAGRYGSRRSAIELLGGFNDSSCQ